MATKPQLTGEGFSSIAGMSTIELYKVLSQMKLLIEQNQQQAKQILIDNPMLTRELFQAQGLSFLLLEQYLKYPRLTGRATVEFTIEKGDGSTFFSIVGGQPQTLATIQCLIIDEANRILEANFEEDMKQIFTHLIIIDEAD